MDNEGVTHDEAKTELSAEAQALAEKGRSGTIDLPDPLVKLIPAPAGTPEKFWDPVEGKLRVDDLIKSYSELETKLGQPADAGDEDEGGEDDEGSDGEDDPAAAGEADDPADEGGDDEGGDDDEGADAPTLTTAIESAQVAYAETGELNDEARAPLRAAGISDDQIDLYLSGVKAAEKALEDAVTGPFGSREAYDEAVSWAAAGGMTPKQITAFNGLTGAVETAKTAGKMLFDAYKAANPGEGKFVDLTTGMNHGDVYKSMAEFHKDLAAADAVRDKVARKDAVEKLARSRKARSIK